MVKNKISVIIPMKNAQHTIIRTLASLISNMDWIANVVVVDDGSTDDGPELVQIFSDNYPQVELYSSSGSDNPGVARRDGIYYADGEWITFVDADDCLTASSLRYVLNKLNEYGDDIVLLHTKTLYYESGNFNTDSIEFQDLSCGGNFYRKDYLIKHNLLPHSNLPMSEDEYFNSIVTNYIDLVDGTADRTWWDYPVYEVHHDIDDGLSYATSNWQDYLIKYHLLSQIYVSDFFKPYVDLNDPLRYRYMNNYVFCYFMLLGIMLDNDVDCNVQDALEDFTNALDYYYDRFGGSDADMIQFYNDEDIESIQSAAEISTGVKIEPFIAFEEFIRNLHPESNGSN